MSRFAGWCAVLGFVLRAAFGSVQGAVEGAVVVLGATFEPHVLVSFNLYNFWLENGCSSLCSRP